MISFSDSETFDVGDFWKRYSTWQENVFANYQADVKDPNFESVTRHSLNMGEVLDKMSPTKRKSSIADFKKLIGLDTVIDEQVTSWRAPYVTDDFLTKGDTDNFRWLLSPGRHPDSPVGRLIIDPEAIKSGDPRAILMNALSIQYRERNIAEGASPLTIGRNLPTEQSAKGMVGSNLLKLDPGEVRSVLVLDTETAGLMEESGVREIAGFRMKATGTADGVSFGKLSSKADYNEHFRTAQMQLGYSYDKGGLGRKASTGPTTDVGKYLFGLPDYKGMPGSGPEYVEKLRPFLSMIDESDVIVAHNLDFDLNRVLVDLARTGDYQNNVNGFKPLLDSVRGKVAGMQKVDTLQIARELLKDIPLAKELEFSGEATVHSLGNIMLESNFLDILADDTSSWDKFTPERVRSAGGKKQALLELLDEGLHGADVDTGFEAQFLRYAHMTDEAGDPLLKVRPSDTAKLQNIDWALRNRIATAYAPTPVSNIANVSHVNPELFSRIVAEGRVKVMTDTGGIEDYKALKPDESRQLYDALAGNQEARTAFGFGKRTPHYQIKLKAIEQQAFIERQSLAAKAVDLSDRDWAFSLGEFKRYAGVEATDKGFLNQGYDLFNRGVVPELSQYREFQTRLASRGMPFAGLSMPERWMTSAMSSAGGLQSNLTNPSPSSGLSAMTAAERRAATIGDDIGISRFGKIASPYITAKGGRNVSLPVELLMEAEKQGALTSSNFNRGGTLFGSSDEVQELGLSLFETMEGEKRANLIFNIGSDEEAKGLAEWLVKLDPKETMAGGKTLREMGYSSHALREIAEQLPESGMRHGIGVGQLTGNAAEQLYRANASMTQNLMRDEMIPWRMGFLGVTDSSVQVGAAYIDAGLDPSFADEYKGGLNIAQERLRRLNRVTQDDHLFNAVEGAYRRGLDPDVAKAAMASYEVFKKRLPIVGGVAAGALGLYYMYRKRQESQEANEPFQQMPIEGRSAGRPDILSEDAMMYSNQRQTDPLATAGIPANLSNARIGHNNMSPKKNSKLFGGAL